MSIFSWASPQEEMSKLVRDFLSDEKIQESILHLTRKITNTVIDASLDRVAEFVDTRSR